MLDWAGPRTRGRRHPCPCRRPVPAKGRWTPPTKWPGLPVERQDGHGPAPPRQRSSGSRWPSRAGPRSPARCGRRVAGEVQLPRATESRNVFRSDQPRRPRARTCCRFSSAKTLLMPGRNTRFPTGVNVSGRYPEWPVFRCPLMAAFGCPPRPRPHGCRRGDRPHRPPRDGATDLRPQLQAAGREAQPDPGGKKGEKTLTVSSQSRRLDRTLGVLFRVATRSLSKLPFPDRATDR